MDLETANTRKKSGTLFQTTVMKLSLRYVYNYILLFNLPFLFSFPGYSNASFLATFSTLYPPVVTPLIFDQEVLNPGDNYNPMTGVYIAPLDGDYMFNLHLWCTDFDNLYPFLVVDGQRVFDYLLPENFL